MYFWIMLAVLSTIGNVTLQYAFEFSVLWATLLGPIVGIAIAGALFGALNAVFIGSALVVAALRKR